MQGYLFYLLTGSALVFCLGVISYRYRKIPGRRYFWILMLLSSFMILATVLELKAGSFQAKLWWRNIQQVPLFFCGIFIYALAWDYVGKSTEQVLRQIRLFSIPIVVFLLLVFTDSFHHLMRSEVGLEVAGKLSGITVRPTLFSMVFMVYNQLFPLFALFILAVHLRNAPRHYYKQHFMLLIGLSLPVLLTFLLPIFQVKMLGYTALAIIPGCLIIYYAVFRFQLLSVWPVTKDKVFACMKDGVVVTDRYDAIADLNPSAERILSVLAGDGPKVRMGRALDPYLRRDAGLLSAYRKKEETKLEMALPGEPELHYEVTLIPIALEGSHYAGMLLVFSDISDKKRYERQLMAQATVDDLTGVFNRRHFLRLAGERLASATDGAALLLLDIDDFKLINDAYGHLAGDRALSGFSGILAEAYAGKGIVGRVGGEEFAVLLADLTEQESLEGAERFRRGIEARMIPINEEERIAITVSIGIAFADAGRVAFEALYQRADAALYASKETGKNKVTLGKA